MLLNPASSSWEAKTPIRLFINTVCIIVFQDSLMAQNYGYNGGPEYGALWNGR